MQARFTYLYSIVKVTQVQKQEKTHWEPPGPRTAASKNGRGWVFGAHSNVTHMIKPCRVHAHVVVCQLAGPWRQSDWLVLVNVLARAGNFADTTITPCTTTSTAIIVTNYRAGHLVYREQTLLEAKEFGRRRGSCAVRAMQSVRSHSASPGDRATTASHYATMLSPSNRLQTVFHTVLNWASCSPPKPNWMVCWHLHVLWVPAADMPGWTATVN